MVSWRWKLLCPSVAALGVAAGQYACSETGPDADPRVNGCLTEGCLEAGTTGEGGTTDGGANPDGGTPIVYPDPLEGTTKAATRVIGNRNFVEGPVWIGGRLLFTDVPANVILELSGTATTNFRTNSRGTNGLAVDPEGRLLMCEGNTHQVTRMNATSGMPVNKLYDSYGGKLLNSPNDVVVRKDNNIYFTDPNYGGADGASNQLPYQGAYRIDRIGALTRIDGTFNKANGIGLSPDGNTLYIVDNGAGKLLSAPVDADGKPGAFAQIADVPGGDGMAVDDAGNVYVAADDGIDVFDKTGAKKIGTVTVTGKASNCTFGGNDRKTLFITANSSAIPGVDGGPATNNPATGLYSLELKVPGLP